MRPLHERREAIVAALAAARADGRCRGAMLLATCNRFEVVFELADTPPDQLRRDVFGDVDVELEELHDADAILHLIRVATGLESLVLGEDQIIGQVGQAFRESDGHGLLGHHLHRLYARVMHAARRLRQHRPAIHGPRSVAELAARLAREAGPRVAVVGAGTTAHTAAESLRDLGAHELHFRNRSVPNAARLARHFHGTAGSLDDLLLSPPDVDAVVVAISGRQLHLPAQAMPNLKLVVDVCQPTAVVNLHADERVRFLDLDALALLEQDQDERMQEWLQTSSRLAEDEAQRIWSELDRGRVDLGQLLGLHVENATSEVDRALRGRLRELPQELADEVRRLAERVARRNAHLHLSDVRHFVAS